MEKVEKALENKEKVLTAFEKVVASELLNYKLLYGNRPDWPEIFASLEKRYLNRDNPQFTRISRLPKEIQSQARQIARLYFDVEKDALLWKKRNISVEADKAGSDSAPFVGSRLIKSMLKNVDRPGGEGFWRFIEDMVKADRDRSTAEMHKKSLMRGFFSELVILKTLKQLEGAEVILPNPDEDVHLGIDFKVKTDGKAFLVQVKGRQLEGESGNLQLVSEREEGKQVFLVEIKRVRVDEADTESFAKDQTRLIEIMTPEEWQVVRGHIKSSPSKKEPSAAALQTPFSDQSPLKLGFLDERWALNLTEPLLEEDEFGRFMVDPDTGEKIYVDSKIRSKLASACRKLSEKPDFKGKEIFGLTFWVPYLVRNRQDEFFVNERGEFQDLGGLKADDYVKSQLEVISHYL